MTTKQKIKEKAIYSMVKKTLCIIQVFGLILCAYCTKTTQSTPLKPPEPPEIPVQYSTLSINLSSNLVGSSVSFSGASVTVKNEKENPNLVFSETASGPEVIFAEIPFGDYSISVTYPLHKVYFLNDLKIETPYMEHDVTLLCTSITIGDIIHFGPYTWQVLDIQNHQALIISQYIVQEYAYSDVNDEITWSQCDLRSYLNGYFLENSFNAYEKEQISLVRNFNLNNPEYGTSGGESTFDKVFILDYLEVLHYFPNQSDRVVSSLYWHPGYYSEFWWLRLPGINSTQVSIIDRYGIFNFEGVSAEYAQNILYGDAGYTHSGGVRPAIWLNL